MAKLTGQAIRDRIQNKDIVIEPYNPERVNPNSVNLRIAPKLLIYKPRRWWTPWRKPLVWGQVTEPDKVVEMDERGYLIKPGWFYLGSTVEWTETKNTEPIIDGRSTTGRVSVHVHATAGFGDVGFYGCWTLEIYSIVTARIFPYTPICQISYSTLEGEIKETYQGSYKGHTDPVPAHVRNNGKI